MTTFTPSLRLWQGTPGDPAIRNAWGTWLNENQSLVEAAVTDTASVNIAGLTTYTLTVANGASDQARPLVQSFTGALTGDCTVTLPAVPKIGWAINGTTGSHNVILTTGSGATATVPPDGNMWWYSCDGTNVSFPGVGYGGSKSSAGLVSSGFDAGGANVRMVGGSYGAFWRNDGSNTYFLLTASGSQYGSYNGLRPIAVNDATGAVTLDGTGAGVSTGGNLAVTGGTTTGSLGVSGNTTTDGVTYFGTSGQFYANPNNSGNQLLNFAANQYLQFVPGDGFTLNTTGNIHLNGGVTVNGVGLCYNNGGTYAINITGASGSAPWAGISGKPYAFNQSTDVGATPSFDAITTSGGGGWSIVQNSAAGAAVTALDINQVASGPPAVGMLINISNTSGDLAIWELNGGVVGSITTNGAQTFYNTTSDARLKIDDGALDDGVAGSIIDRLKTRMFRWKDAPDREPELGFFAQQVMRIFPGAVTRGRGRPGQKNFKPWQMDQSKLIPLLVAELQSLRKRIAALEKGS